MVPSIKIEDYNYNLPDERIAKYPLAQRDSSKLLYYSPDRDISCHGFTELPSYIDENSLMFFNDTKVVPARLFFRRASGAHIEVFCLEPSEPSDYNVCFASTSTCVWKCVVGNVKRWKGDVLSCYDPDGRLSNIALKASLVERMGQTSLVRFDWNGGLPFSQVLEMCGNVPIPPYLNRETEPIDYERYQTLYAKERGSVAAPTAGLHFSQRVLAELENKGVDCRRVCLHVGAGTFLPVKDSDVARHPMHREPFIIKTAELEALARGDRPVVAVGTTSVRTLESLYYAGVSIIETGNVCDVEQWSPYIREYGYSTKESLEAIVAYLKQRGLDALELGTRIIILPGFKFRIVDKLVTNFHQPQSTLILLVSAFVGGDWRRIYDFALGNDFRFLSYGDSSLLCKHL